MSATHRSDECVGHGEIAADATLYEAVLRTGRLAASGVAHDINSAMQGLGDALFVIGEELNAALDGIAAEEATGDLAERLRESLQLADSAYTRLTSVARNVSEIVPGLESVSEPIDLRVELDQLIAATSHQWKHRLDVSVVVDPSMPSFTCTWWVARLATTRLFEIAAETHAPRRGADRSLPRFRMTASESEGFVSLRVLCDQPSSEIAPPTPIAPRHADPTLQLCASRLNGEVASVPCSLGSFGLAFRFPVSIVLGLDEAASR